MPMTFRATLRLGLLAALTLAVRADEPDSPVEQTARFAFHSNARMSLHHFLTMWVAGEASDRVKRPHEIPMPSQSLRAQLSAEEDAAWGAAVDYYRRVVAGRSVLFDRGLVAFKTWLREGGELKPSNQALLAELRKVEPIYHRVWWPQHDAGNRAWLRDVLPHVRRLESEIGALLAEIFGGTWPAQPVRVDMVPHANELTAYTTWEPHVTISTAPANAQLPVSLELIFHEPCHADTLQGAIERAIRAAEERTGLKAPRDLWHVVLFQTTGCLIEEYWHANGRPDYHRLIDAIAQRVKAWQPQLAAVDRHWTPVIRARGEGRAAALDSILRELAEGPPKLSAPGS